MCRSTYKFDFDAPFEVQDDVQVLKRQGLSLGLNECEIANAGDVSKLKAYLPPRLQHYIDSKKEIRIASDDL